MNETLLRTWFGGAWFLAGLQKSRILAAQQKPKPIAGVESLGKLGEDDDKEEEPATARKREYTD